MLQEPRRTLWSRRLSVRAESATTALKLDIIQVYLGGEMQGPIARITPGEWQEEVKKDALAEKPGGQLLKQINALIDEFDWLTVPAQQGQESGVFGCRCGKNCKCQWNTLRIDVQRTFKVGNSSWISIAVQKGKLTYAALNIQCGVMYNAAPNVHNLRDLLRQSMDYGTRSCVASIDGQAAYKTR